MIYICQSGLGGAKELWTQIGTSGILGQCGLGSQEHQVQLDKCELQVLALQTWLDKWCGRKNSDVVNGDVWSTVPTTRK